MTKFFQGLSIRHRLFTMIGIAVLFLVAFSLPKIVTAWTDRVNADQTLLRVEFANNASLLVHELQRERGTSSGYLASQGRSAFAKRMAAQRSATDIKLKNFSAFLKAQSYAAPQLEKDLKAVSSIRGEVSRLAIDRGKMTQFYTGIITQLLDVFSVTLQQSENIHIMNDGSALLALLQAKEASGLERSAGAAGFASEVYPAAIDPLHNQLIAQQAAYLKIFNNYAPQQFVAAFKKLSQSDAQAVVEQMRAAGFVSARTGAASNISATDWFAAATKRIDALFALEQSLSAHLSEVASAAKADLTLVIIGQSVLMVVSILILIGLGYVLSESICRPIAALMETTESLCLGIYDAEIPYQSGDSEISDFARNLSVLQSSLEEGVMLRDEQEAERAQQMQADRDRQEAERKRDQEERIRAERAAAQQQNAISVSLKELAETVEHELAQMIESLFAVATQAYAGSNDLISSSKRVTGDVQAASQASSSAAKSSQAIASAAEEMHSSIEDVTNQVAATRALIGSTSSEATNVSESLTGLTNAANRIANMVTIISDIAEQTNLLALNATIEAARAGDAGKGFAVVAGEVKSLANQTSRSLEQIQSGVVEMQNEVVGAVDRVQNIAHQMTELTQRSDTVSSAVEQQSAVTHSITQSIKSASSNVDEVAGQIENVARENNTLAARSDEISTYSKQIEEGVRSLQSRLLAVIKETNAKSERRRSERNSLEPATTSVFETADGARFETTLIDFSSTGLRIAQDDTAALSKGDVVRAMHDGLSLELLVAWANAENAGLSFLDLRSAQPMVQALRDNVASGDALALAS